MRSYLITYDLLNPGQDYKLLHMAIRALNPMVWHGLESVWLLQSPSTAIQLRDYLSQFIDGNDRILVVEVAPQWAAKNLNDQPRLCEATGTVPIAA